MATNVYTNLFHERRRRRSDNPLIATRLQLAQVMADFELDACVIATEDGRLFAAPEQMLPEDADILASIAPQAVANPDSFAVFEAVASCAGAITPNDVHVQEFWAWDQPMIILSVGRLDEVSEASLYRAILGIRRIARQTLERAA